MNAPATPTVYIPKLSVATHLVLRLFVDAPSRELYGRQVSKVTGLLPGTVHPILTRLRAFGWLAERWEGRRLYYRMAPRVVGATTMDALKDALDAEHEHVAEMREALTKRPPKSSQARGGPEVLSHMRAERGLTQERLAQMMSVTAPWVSRIENRGIRATRVRALEEYLAAMGGKLRLMVEFDEGIVEL